MNKMRRVVGVCIRPCIRVYIRVELYVQLYIGTYVYPVNYNFDQSLSFGLRLSAVGTMGAMGVITYFFWSAAQRIWYL